MFRLFKNKKNKPDPILEALEKQNKRLEELLIEKRKENAKVKEEISKAEKVLKELGYTDDDLKRIEQKSKMKVIKNKDEA